jgi:hypothetical protein
MHPPVQGGWPPLRTGPVSNGCNHSSGFNERAEARHHGVQTKAFHIRMHIPDQRVQTRNDPTIQVRTIFDRPCRLRARITCIHMGIGRENDRAFQYGSTTVRTTSFNPVSEKRSGSAWTTKSLERSCSCPRRRPRSSPARRSTSTAATWLNDQAARYGVRELTAPLTAQASSSTR